ncbi:MAG: hypothetical protein J5I47_01955 [Vicingus serpentipes]|nr:hypothetical protein [Vicingus serpentipes]
MGDLIKQDGDNVGGFNKLEIIDLGNTSFIPEHQDFVISDNIQLLKNWFNVAFTWKTLKADDGETEKDGETIYRPNITFFHPKENETSLQWLKYYNEKNLIAKITDNNGNVRIYGSIEAPLRLRYKSVGPSSFSGRPGYSVTIYGLSLLPGLYFTGSTTIDSGSGSSSGS